VSATVPAGPRAGKRLTVAASSDDPWGSALAYQWLIDGAAIPGATAATYQPLAHQAGRRLSVRITATNAVGTGTTTVTAGLVRQAPQAATGPVAVTELRPIFEIIGNRIFHVGAVGQASKIKAITNMLAFIHLVADGEALMLAKKGGIDLKTAYDVIQASSGNSFVHETEGQLVLNGSYQIDFSFDLALKDLGFIDDMSREYDVPVELASLVRQTYIRGKAQYGGDAESPMIVKLLEDACGTDLRADGFPAHLES
jgi:3-hydroxyisobutyrate dehydrogenase